MQYIRLGLEGSTLYEWNSGIQLIILYWTIRFCSRGGCVFSCLEITSRVRTYFLRKPCWMNTFRYFRRAQQYMVWCLLHSW